MKVQIRALERFDHADEHSLVFDQDVPGKHGWFAKVDDTAGMGTYTLLCSKLDGEGAWVVDGRFRGSLPIFHNGIGFRCTLLEQADQAVQDELEGRLAS